MTLPDWTDAQAVKDFLIAEYAAQYESVKAISATADKETDQISASRAAQAALDALAKLTGTADIRPEVSVTYQIRGLESLTNE